MNRFPAAYLFLLPILGAGFVSDSNAQHTPAVARETEAAIERILNSKLQQHNEQIQALVRRIEHLERITYTGGNTGVGQNTGDPNQYGYSDQVVHTVQAGDTLFNIAQRHHVTVDDLTRANRMDPNGVIYIGDRLYIPRPGVGSYPPNQNPDPFANTNYQNQNQYQQQPPYTGGQYNQQPPAAGTGTHIVRPGDTLTRIAAMNRTTVDELMRINRLSNPHQIQVGQTLHLPGSGYQAPGQQNPQNPGTQQRPPQQQTKETYHYYEVVQGDSLGTIAKTFFTDIETLKDLNRFGPDAKLNPGQQIVVPTSKYFQYMDKQGVIGANGV